MSNIKISLGRLLLAYIFFMPFTSALAYTSAIFPSLVIAIIMLFLIASNLAFSSNPLPVKIHGRDGLLVLTFITTVVFSYLLNGTSHPKSLNHTIGYITSFLILFLLIRYILAALHEKENIFPQILKVITYTCILSSLYTCLEFYLKNFGSLDIDSLIPRAKNEDDIFNPLFLGLFYRARGFTAESGHFMFMMELFTPISVYFLYHSGSCKWAKPIKALTLAVMISAMLLSGSVAGYLIIPLALITTVALRIRSSIKFISDNYRKLLVTVLLAGGILFAVNKLFPVNDMISIAVSEKFDSKSLEDREERNNFFFREFPRLPLVNKIIGAGPAGSQILGFASGNSILNLFLSICFEIGILGILIFAILLLEILRNAVSIKEKFGFFITFSLIGGIMHFVFIANYWYPWFWFICALALFYREFSNRKTNDAFIQQSNQIP